MPSILPLELLIAVISYVRDPGDLKRLCEVSWLLYSITVPRLYTSVTVWVDYGRLEPIAVDELLRASRRTSPNLLHCTKTIQIAYPFITRIVSRSNHHDLHYSHHGEDDEFDRMRDRLMSILLSCEEGLLKSFVWKLGTCVPVEILGPGGYLQVKQPDLKSLHLVTNGNCREFSYDLRSFKKLRKLSWVGLRWEAEFLALGEFFKTTSPQLEYLELDVADWRPGGTYRPELEDRGYFFAHDVFGLSPFGNNRVLFPDLEYLHLSAVSFESTAPGMTSICRFKLLRSLKLRYCPEWDELLNKVTSLRQVIRLETLEIQSFVDYGSRINVGYAISAFMDAFQGLRELYIMIPECDVDPLLIFRSMLHHKGTLKRFVFHQRHIDRDDDSPFWKPAHDVPEFTFLPTSALPSLNPLLGLELECIGICCVPEILKTILSPLAEKSSLKLLHIRQSGLDFDPYGSWGIASNEIDGSTNDSEMEHSSSESSSGNNRPRHITEKLDEFAQWAFGPDGLRSLQILAFGDFSCNEQYSNVNSLLCRNNCSITEEKGNPTKNYRFLTKSDHSLREFLGECYDFGRACPVVAQH